MSDKDAQGREKIEKAEMSGKGRTPTPPTRRFGMQLRAFRENHWERTSSKGRSDAPTPRLRLSALSLIACLGNAGYPITSGAYSEIEAGNSIPRDVNGFLDAVSDCLQLTEDEKQVLIATLGYDLVAPRLGKQAEVILRRTASAARALRHWREDEKLSHVDLATCLIGHGLALNDYSDASSLALFLELIEFGRPWGLGDQERAIFLEKIGQCLGEEARRDLALGFSDDLLRALLPNVKTDFDER